MSPATLVFETPSVPGSTQFGVEFSMRFKAARFASALSWRCFVKVISRKRVSTVAMALSAPDSSYWRLLSKSGMRKEVLTEYFRRIFPASQSPNYCRSGNSNFNGPLSSGKSEPIVLYKNARALIIGLFMPISPPAISRLVMPVVINSFYHKAVRFFSHVGVEIHKIAPSVADSDPPSPIVGIFRFIRITASANDADPNFVDRRMAHTMFYLSQIKPSKLVRNYNGL